MCVCGGGGCSVALPNFYPRSLSRTCTYTIHTHSKSQRPLGTPSPPKYSYPSASHTHTLQNRPLLASHQLSQSLSQTPNKMGHIPVTFPHMASSWEGVGGGGALEDQGQAGHFLLPGPYRHSAPLPIPPLCSLSIRPSSSLPPSSPLAPSPTRIHAVVLVM